MFGVPVLVLLGFPLLVSLHLGRVWVWTFFLLMVNTFAATVFPFKVIADAVNALPDSLVLAPATPSLTSSYSTSLSSTSSSWSYRVAQKGLDGFCLLQVEVFVVVQTRNKRGGDRLLLLVANGLLISDFVVLKLFHMGLALLKILLCVVGHGIEL